MYFLVMYNLSPIQKGIQAGHAALEYAYKYGNDEDYQSFIKNDKTWIILDGGGSEQIKEAYQELDNLGVKRVCFLEPDLNQAMSAIAFLVPNHIYDLQILELEDEYGLYYKSILNGEEVKSTAYNVNLKKLLSKYHLAR